MKKQMLIISLTFALILSLCVGTALAAEGEIVSYDAQTGVTVYRDSGGGIVFSGLPTVYVASDAEQKAQQATIAKNSKLFNSSSPSLVQRGANYVDYENNPIHIGTWNGIKAYARHTLGVYNSTLNYLGSYGYVTWYNTSGNTAVPYRNGNATVAGQDVVDVAKFSYFDIRDLETDTAMTLQITDWGPDQQQHGAADGRERIADLDKNDFKALHGNTTDGVFYARTWVPIKNYNP